MTQARVVEPVEARDFASRDVTAAFRHHADTALRVRRLELADVVHVRRLGRHFEEADRRVSLSSAYRPSTKKTKEGKRQPWTPTTSSAVDFASAGVSSAHLSAEVHHVGVGVVEGEHDAVRRVQFHHDDGVVEVAGRAQRVLAFRHLGEAGGEDEPVAQVDGARRLGTFVADGLFFDIAGARVDDADLLVLAGSEQLGALPVPAGRVDQVGVAVDDHLRAALVQVPHYDQVVRSCPTHHIRRQIKSQPLNFISATYLIVIIDIKTEKVP